MPNRPSLSAFPRPGEPSGSHGRIGALVALLALLLAGAAWWILPQRTLLPLENALRAEAGMNAPPEPRP
jgi:hypothetical protein